MFQLRTQPSNLAALNLIKDTIADTGDIVKYNPTDNDKTLIGDLLKRELKLGLRAKQDDSVVKALSEPTAWLTERKKLMSEAVTEVSGPFAGALAKYRAFYPDDQAIALATEEIRPLFENKLRYLEVIHPGSSLMLPQAVANNRFKTVSAINTTAALSGDASPSVTPEMISYYKQRKAARKQKKRSKK